MGVGELSVEGGRSGLARDESLFLKFSAVFPGERGDRRGRLRERRKRKIAEIRPPS
jgi:hypothetical protein